MKSYNYIYTYNYIIVIPLFHHCLMVYTANEVTLTI